MQAVLNVFMPTWGYEKMMREFLLNSGSTIDEGRLAKGGGKLTGDYTDECAVCDMNLRDYQSMGSPERVRIVSKDGRYSVAVCAVPKDSVMPGHVFMPRAIWANVIVDPETFSTGSPLYKGSPVMIEPTEDEVLSAEELVKKMYLRGRK